MSTDIDELITWLREQIAETEYLARAAADTEHLLGRGRLFDVVRYGWARQPYRDGRPVCDISYQPEAPTPADVLAQCEAHTAIVEGYAALWANTDRHTDAGLHLQYNVLKQVVRALALAYQHRPGYHEEWQA